MTDARLISWTTLARGTDEYPPSLADLRDASSVLSVRGKLPPPELPAVAIVGTRTPSEAGAELAQALGEAFAWAEVVVVSGLARGCDGAAHRGALAGGGKTVAVLGCGIERIYPPEHARLAGEIAQSGAVVSECAPGEDPSVGRLLARNRLIAALSRGTIVVQAGATGGALKTARDAKRLGRLLFAVDRGDECPESLGTRRLIAQGAIPIRGVGDVPEIVAQLRAWQPPVNTQMEITL